MHFQNIFVTSLCRVRKDVTSSSISRNGRYGFIFTSVEYFLYKLYWKRRVRHDSMKSIAMQISTEPPIMTYIVLLSAYEVVDING